MNREQFLQSLLGLITANSSERGFLVSKLGVMLRRMYGCAPWYTMGFQSLKEALKELEMRGVVRTGSDEKNGFAIWLSSTSQNTPSMATSAEHRVDIPYRKLRREVWHAFVSEMPPGMRFMHASAGTIIVGQTVPPGPIKEWKQIQAIPRQLQHQWAREFLQEKHLGDDLTFLGALTAERWYLDFSYALRTRSPSLCSAWNWFRTQRTLDEVGKWRSENDIPEELAFETAGFPAQAEAGEAQGAQVWALSVADPESRLSESGSEQTGDLRARILQAIARMPTAELLELRLPVKYMLDLLPAATAPHPRDSGE